MVGKYEKAGFLVRKILIVGGGASGLLVALNLAHLSREQISLCLAEPRAILGQGVAYSTSDPAHLLNVPAGRMSALVDDPLHFVSFMGCNPGDFISRVDYGRYLLASFVQAEGANPLISFRHERTFVEAIEFNDGRLEAMGDGGFIGEFDSVVLATGHGKSNSSRHLSAVAFDPRVVEDVWRDLIPEIEGTLVSLGTGLTFIDHALTYLRRNNTNKAIGISRTGLLPQAHLAKRAEPLAVPPEVRKSASSIRRFIESAEDWRAAQDGVRHELPDIWFNWDDREKKAFLTEHLRWWNVHRHRVATEIDEEVKMMLEAGRLKIVAGELEGIEPHAERLTLSLSNGDTIDCDLLINSMGYGTGEDSPAIQRLIERGLVSKGPLGLGIATNFPRFEIPGLEETGKKIFAIGPLLIGERFETTAIPEIRLQAREIAVALLS